MINVYVVKEIGGPGPSDSFYTFGLRLLSLALLLFSYSYGDAQSNNGFDYSASYDFTHTTDTLSLIISPKNKFILLSKGGESRFFYANWAYNDSMRALDASSFPEPTVITNESIQAYTDGFTARMAEWIKPERGDEYKVQKLFGEVVANIRLPGYPPRYMQVKTEFDWQITNQQRIIAGYPCILATTHYGGRDYEAWFAPAIPIPDGPYVFGGLPGLIIALNDSRGWYSFQLTDFTADPEERYWPLDYLPRVARRIDRPKFVADLQKIKENFSMPGVDLSAEDLAQMRAARTSRYYLLLEQND